MNRLLNFKGRFLFLGSIFVPAADWKAIDPLHTYMASFRAIENGFSLVRVVRHGFSAAFDYQGRLLAQMDHFMTQDHLMLAHVPTKGTTTIYAQTPAPTAEALQAHVRVFETVGVECYVGSDTPF